MTDFSVFNIKWNNSKNEVNQKTSTAVNTGTHVHVQESQCEPYNQGDNYEIKAGDYHKSGVNVEASTTATIFLFSSQQSRVHNSYVIGPSNISESEINRKIVIDAKSVLGKVNSLVG